MSADSSESTTKNDMFDGTVGDNGVIGDALDDMETAVSEIGNDIEDSFRESTSAQARWSGLDIRVHKKVMPDAWLFCCSNSIAPFAQSFRKQI